MQPDVYSPVAFIRAGASAYLTRQQTVSVVHNAIHTATPEHPILSQDVVDSLVTQHVAPSPLQRQLARLSDRERDLLPYLTQGVNDDARLAEMLQVGERSVSHRRRQIFKKLALPNAVAFPHLAAKLRLIEV